MPGTYCFRDFFRYRKLRSYKEKILIVGDSLTSDIKGGNCVGIKTCWYNPAGKPLEEGYQVDYTIQDLHEIYEVLGMFK